VSSSIFTAYAALLQLVTGFVALYCCEAVLRRKPSHLRLACAGAAALATLWLGEVLRLILVFATLGSELHWYGPVWKSSSASRRWRGGRRDGSARTRRKF